MNEGDECDKIKTIIYIFVDLGEKRVIEIY